MFYCRNCGQKIEDGMMFCPNCGTPCAMENKPEPDPIPEPEPEPQPQPAPNRNQTYNSTRASAPVSANERGTNGLAIAGFICAFFFPFVGLVLSIVALSNARNGDYEKPLTGLATWGIIVSAVLLVLRIALFFVAGFVLMPLIIKWITQLIGYITAALAVI